MTTLPLTLLDYGVGNIHSIKKCFERAGASVAVETEPSKILGVMAGCCAIGEFHLDGSRGPSWPR